VLIICIVGYALASVLYSGARVAEAERTLDAVVSHQNSLNVTFGDIDAQVSTLNTSATFDSGQALMLVDLSIENSRLATKTINEDDQSLSAASNDVRAAPWLTTMGRSGLDHEAARIAHARAALAVARAIAEDQALDGQFWYALYAGLADFANYSASSSPAAFDNAKTEIEYAAQMAAYAPGLPDDLRALMTDLQTFLADTGAGASVAGDLDRIAAHNLDAIGVEINAFYQPMIDRYNSEISAATS
jgi:hypothetical protein